MFNLILHFVEADYKINECGLPTPADYIMARMICKRLGSGDNRMTWREQDDYMWAHHTRQEIDGIYDEIKAQYQIREIITGEFQPGKLNVGFDEWMQWIKEYVGMFAEWEEKAMPLEREKMERNKEYMRSLTMEVGMDCDKDSRIFKEIANVRRSIEISEALLSPNKRFAITMDTAQFLRHFCLTSFI